ncbi:MAG TPA: hypothetical protein VNH38_05715 [Candidatus Dormibacteraeota bacterium]|nr:hypothetical protein [Candidatus Dormibacteraeota bacterium]
MARRSRTNRLGAKAGVATTNPHVLTGAQASGTGRYQLVREWSPTAARFSLALVLLWFGLHELVQPSLWTGYIPIISQTSHLALAMVLLHGWVLSVLGVALILGIAPQLAAGVSALLLLEIVLSLSLTGGVSDIVARDLGVFGLAVAVFASDRQKLVLQR